MTRFHSHAFPFARPILCAAVLSVVSGPALARPSCTFTSVSPVNFGTYDVFAAAPNNSGVGSITIRCQGGNGSFVVTLSNSHGVTPRVMNSGGNTLNYNLYTSAARNQVWGDDSGGTRTRTVDGTATTRLDIFGQIPPGQDVATGTYGDNITAIVNF
jgi:spore coat protein U-like protein